MPLQGGIRFAGRRMQGHGLSRTSSPGPRLLPEERVQECVQRCLRGPMPLRLPGGPLSLTHVKLYSSCPALASGCVSPPVHGVGSRPSARLKLAAPCSRPPTATSPAPPTTMKSTPPASLGRRPFHTKPFPGAISVIAYWDRGKDSAFPYLFGAGCLPTANVRIAHPP